MIDNTKIAEKINEKLVNNPNIEAGNIWVDVEDGEVTLSGSVADKGTKDLTEKVVHDVAGVNKVENLLETPEGDNKMNTEGSVRTVDPDAADKKAQEEENKKHGGSSQFRYDTPFDGGSAYDKAAAEAAKKGKWVTSDEEVEKAKHEVKRELGQE